MHCGINRKVTHADGTFGVVKNCPETRSFSKQCTFHIYLDTVRSYCRISLLLLVFEYYWHRVRKMFGMTIRYLIPRPTLPSFDASRFTPCATVSNEQWPIG